MPITQRTPKNVPVNAPPLINPSALAILPNGTKSPGRIEAVLLEYDVEGKVEKPLWLFLVNPATLDYQASAQYAEASPLASKVKAKQFTASSGEKLTISDLIFETYCLGKSLLPLSDGLKALLEAKTEQGKFAPPILLFRWGKKRFGPCVLTDVRRTETAWLDGDPARMKLTLTLEEIPKPPTKAELEAKKKAREEAAAQRREAEGKPPLKLTGRQQQEAVEAAKAYLKANAAAFSADVQKEIEKGDYQLATDPDTGDVTLSSAKGDKIGVVLRSLGDNKIVANSKVTSVPLASGAKLPELVPKS